MLLSFNATSASRLFQMVNYEGSRGFQQCCSLLPCFWLIYSIIGTFFLRGCLTNLKGWHTYPIVCYTQVRFLSVAYIAEGPIETFKVEQLQVENFSSKVPLIVIYLSRISTVLPWCTLQGSRVPKPFSVVWEFTLSFSYIVLVQGMLDLVIFSGKNKTDTIILCWRIQLSKINSSARSLSSYWWRKPSSTHYTRMLRISRSLCVPPRGIISVMDLTTHMIFAYTKMTVRPANLNPSIPI